MLITYKRYFMSFV